MKKLILLALLHMFIGVHAQTNAHADSSYFGPENPIKCGQHLEQEKYFSEHPDDRLIHEAEQLIFQEEYERYLANDFSPNSRAASYVIPVVVHITHLGGVDDISDEQVKDAIKKLNEDFSAINNDVTNTIPEFESIIGNAGIEFRLATKDPDGNCHTGITRTYSVNTSHDNSSSNNNKNNLLEDIVDKQGLWPQNRYMNIIVCQNPNGAGGYTNYPSNSYNQNGMGGSIFIRHDRMGSIGTSSLFGRHILSHEVGHWLNLAHTWGSTNDPENINSCDLDDRVNDTPNTIGWTSCSKSGSSCGSLDNVQNIMEYSFCATMFTEGQAARMQTALNSATAGRNKLWKNVSPDFNLDRTGVNFNSNLCETAFESDAVVICAGGSVKFSDLSFHNITERSWEFSGGIPANSSDQSPIVVYDTPGTYSVSLEASDGTNTEREVKTGYILVLGGPESSLPYSESFEDLSGLNDKKNIFLYNEENDASFELYEGAASNGDVSARLMNFGVTNKSKDALISPPIDLSSLDESNKPIFNFKYAYKRRSNNDNEILEVFVSRDCGKSWILKKRIRGSKLGSEIQSSSYTPENDWFQVDIINLNSSDYISDFRFKIEFTNDRGNNMFIDDINIYSESSLGSKEIKEQANISLFPNPAIDNVLLKVNSLASKEVGITILNSVGKIVMTYNQIELNENKLFEISTYDLSSGVYFVRIDLEDQVLTERLIVSH